MKIHTTTSSSIPSAASGRRVLRMSIAQADDGTCRLHHEDQDRLMGRYTTYLDANAAVLTYVRGLSRKPRHVVIHTGPAAKRLQDSRQAVPASAAA